MIIIVCFIPMCRLAAVKKGLSVSVQNTNANSLHDVGFTDWR